jgi:calcineurin-like phosphoesterase
MPQKFEIADGPVQFNAVAIDIDTEGKARSIERIDRVVEV